MAINFPLGKDSFTKLREEKCYYVDKTEIIAEILKEKFDVHLITRPRRFGKTLTMSMLEDFFDISRDSRERFAGLKISDNTTLCSEWQNQWPVIFFTLKTVEGRNFQSAYGSLEVLISSICKKYEFLSESNRVNDADKALFRELEYQKAEAKNLKDCLFLLTRMMYAHYGKQCILLIDEYDVPLSKANDNDFFVEMLDVIKAMFSAFKTNDYLKFAVVTGCLKIAKESIFTGTNNFVADSITSDRFDEYIGFTQGDVEKLLFETDFEDHAEEIKLWYDGYRFGSVDVYCPWDVLNHVAALQVNPQTPPRPYWANTSGNSILKQVLKKAGRTTKSEIEKLIDGESVWKKITDQITYNDLDKSIANLWSVMYLTGYLTARNVDDSGRVELRIPNQEVREIFVSQISEWFTEDVAVEHRKKWLEFCKAMENGKAEEAESLLTDFLSRGISIRDTASRKSKKENFYHGLLLGLMMTNDEWDVYSNREDGDGYSDIHVEGDDIAFVVEIKYAENNALEAACHEALNQIERNRYIEGLKELGFQTVYAYGIACYKKRCKIVKK